jgi:hypothetical protein
METIDFIDGFPIMGKPGSRAADPYPCVRPIHPIEIFSLSRVRQLVICLTAISFAMSRAQMNFDDVLFGLILCGIGIGGAALRNEYLRLRQLRAMERRYQRAMREFHLKRLSGQAGDGEP